MNASVKRYSVGYVSPGDDFSAMWQSNDGQWIRIDDYIKVEDERDNWKEESEANLAALKEVQLMLWEQSPMFDSLKKDARVLALHFREHHAGESSVLDIISDRILEVTKDLS